jgi:hypothetical protein
MELGISALLVGICAVILTDQTKLTATKLLLGGVYIKDQYREALLFAGIALAILGALLAILSAVRAAEPAAISSLSRITGALLVLTLVGGGFIYVAYRYGQRNVSTECTGTSASQQSSSSPGSGANGEASPTPTAAECTPPTPVAELPGRTRAEREDAEERQPGACQEDRP